MFRRRRGRRQIPQGFGDRVLGFRLSPLGIGQQEKALRSHFLRITRDIRAEVGITAGRQVPRYTGSLAVPWGNISRALVFPRASFH
jgi:hypothetical protein